MVHLVQSWACTAFIALKHWFCSLTPELGSWGEKNSKIKCMRIKCVRITLVKRGINEPGPLTKQFHTEIERKLTNPGKNYFNILKTIIESI